MRMQTQHPILMGMIISLLSCFSHDALSASSDAFDRNLDEFILQEMTLVKRIQNARINFLNDAELEKLYRNNPTIGDTAGCPVLKVRLEVLPCKNDGNGLRSFILPNTRSPSALTVIESYTPVYFERRKGIWVAAINNDHQWLPAIIDFIRINRGGADQGYGSLALELTEPGLNMANQALAFLADNYCILTNVHGNLSELILEKVNKIEFSENYIERKYRMMAGLAYHSGDLEKALQLYALVKSDKFRKESIYYRVSKIHKELGDGNKAYEALQDGFQKFPKSSILFMCMAEHKFADKEYNEALKNIDKCLQLTPENPRVHILKARILADLRCRHEAMNSCIHAIQYSYGWDKEILDQINAVIQRLNNAETKK